MRSSGNNPPQRYPERSLLESEEKWWIAKVKPRQEKLLAEDFIEREIEYYLPQFIKVTRRKDNNKPRKSVCLLFPGYISFCMNVPHDIYTTNRIVRVIDIKNQQQFCQQMEAIRIALEGGIVVGPVEQQFDIDEKVEVFQGPLRGAQGIVTKINNQKQMVITVEGLGNAVVAVNPACLRSLEKRNK